MPIETGPCDDPLGQADSEDAACPGHGGARASTQAKQNGKPRAESSLHLGRCTPAPERRSDAPLSNRPAHNTRLPYTGRQRRGCPAASTGRQRKWRHGPLAGRLRVRRSRKRRADRTLQLSSSTPARPPVRLRARDVALCFLDLGSPLARAWFLGGFGRPAFSLARFGAGRPTEIDHHFTVSGGIGSMHCRRTYAGSPSWTITT